MKSFNLKKLLVNATLASVIALTGTLVVGNSPLYVQAVEMNGTLTVTASSLWTYSSADWSARAQVVSGGSTFSISDKISVDGKDMYKLTNGLYITANTAYVKAQEVTVSATSYKVTTANLNMRTGAGSTAGIILTIPQGTTVQVLDSSNGWDKVVYNGNTGWCSSTYLSASSAPAAPVASTLFKAAKYNLNMRTGPGTGYAKILTIPAGGKVQVVGSSGGWDKIVYNGYVGWASSDYLVEISQNVSRTDVVNYAKTLLGIPYTYGGDTPAEGFDCSGFTKYVFAQFGITLPRVSRDQANVGNAINIVNMQPGDLMYFGNNGTVSHIGIYIGNNEMIHAPSPGKFVEIRDITWHVNNYDIVGANSLLN